MINIHLQNVAREKHIPPDKMLRRWTLAALEQYLHSGEVTLRIVNANEIQLLNRQYRHQDKPTNVLAFPFVPFDNIGIGKVIIGDVVICATIVNAEAKQQNKSQDQHWAHIIIHGMLHLLGYKHDKEDDAKQMESLEIKLLQQFGYTNPYL